MRIKIVGTKYTKKELIINEIIKLVHEKNNKFDDKAIAVINSDGEKCGYVATKNTLSPGNRKNGCIDNEELLKVLQDDTIAVVEKAFKDFGYANIQ